MADKSLKNYVPTGKGRPPNDPKKLRLWKRANEELRLASGKGDSTPKAPAKGKKEKAPKAPIKEKKEKAPVAPAAERAGATRGGTVFRAPRGAARVLSAGAELSSRSNSVLALLSDNNLRDIIALCRKEGVSRLKTSDLEIELDLLARVPSTGLEAPRHAEKTVPVDGTASVTAAVPTFAVTSDPTGHEDLDDVQDLIDNPVDWEAGQVDRAMRQGALSAESQDRRVESDLRGS